MHMGRVWLRTGLLFGFERSWFFREGGFSENYLSLPLRALKLIITGLIIRMVVGRVGSGLVICWF